MPLRQTRRTPTKRLSLTRRPNSFLFLRHGKKSVRHAGYRALRVKGYTDQMTELTTTLSYWFSDLESSTRLWEQFPQAMREALSRHDLILHESVNKYEGRVVKTTGDGLMAVFDLPLNAVLAGIQVQERLHAEEWGETGPLRVRIGIHLGESQPRAGDYYGTVVNRAARIMAAGHGGQILLSGSVAEVVRKALPDQADLRDLGEHRLKDLSGPEHLFQLVVHGLPDSFPALSTLDSRPNNLPTQTSVFLGRETELSELRALIDSSETRLLTMIGPGGIGKTRLALQAAVDQIDRFEDGLFFVDLAPAVESDEVFSAIFRTIGFEGSGEATPLEALKKNLANRHMLLLLDNFEQVTEAAVGLADLLGSCAGITSIVTSREALRVRGERLYPVPPLSLPPSGNGKAPPIESVMESEAVVLLVERAVEVYSNFEITTDNVSTIASICIRLDGLPLAIELAAARLKIFSPEELLVRLSSRLDLLRGGARDLPSRQQTLRNTIEWSYDLLESGERVLFEVFSVFSGARIEAVEAIAGKVDVLSSIDVIDGLESLVDKSLIRRVETEDGKPRFTMLETIREYAHERLGEQPEVARKAKEEHALYYVELARKRRPELAGERRHAVLAELHTEQENLREAWRYWLEIGDLERLYHLLDTLWVLYDAYGWYHGVIELANDLLGVLAMTPESAERVREEIALQTSIARALMTLRGYSEEVEQAFAKALQLSEKSGDVPQRFPVLRNLVSLYMMRGEVARTREIAADLLSIANDQGDPILQIDGNLYLGVSLAYGGQFDRGMEHLDEAIRLFDPNVARSERFRLGPNPGIAALTSSAIMLWMHGFPDRAVQRAGRAEEIARKIDHPSTMAYMLHHVTLIDVFRQDLERVADHAAESLKVANANDYPIWRALALMFQGLARIGFGEVEEGLAKLENGIELYQGRTTPPVFWPIVLTLISSAYGMAGQIDKGLARINEALSFLPPDDPGYCDPQIVRGDLMLSLPEPKIEEAKRDFTHTLDLAHSYGLRMAELRAATRLVELAKRSRGEAEALEALKSVYASFTAGFDTPDLIAARKVLGLAA
jgi:predicted ATPase/class 3 adenylate cyclase